MKVPEQFNYRPGAEQVARHIHELAKKEDRSYNYVIDRIVERGLKAMAEENGRKE